MGRKDCAMGSSSTQDHPHHLLAHPHEDVHMWTRWLNWFLDTAEVQCVECDGRGNVGRIQCDRCEGQGLKLSRFGEKILHAHEFFERLQERERYRRSKRR